MRYIDADALGIGKAERNAFTVPEYADGWNSAIEIIENAPTADVVEVRHGEWEYRQLDEYKFYEVTCSCCGAKYWGNYDSYNDPDEFYYCPCCGAKMDGERKEG